MDSYIKIRNNKFKDKKYGKNSIIGLIDSSAINLERAEVDFANIKINNVELNRQLKANMVNIKKSKEMIMKEREYIKVYFMHVFSRLFYQNELW